MQKNKTLILSEMVFEESEYSVILTSFSERPDLIEKAITARSLAYHQAYSSGRGVFSEDRDGFDEHYQHIVVLKGDSSEVIAGFRFVLTDAVLKQQGLSGFATYDTYHYTDAFFRYLGPSLEMGRLFVIEEYQKKGIALELLWTGFAKYLIDNPHLHYLYGSVSFPGDFDSEAATWISSFCHSYRLDSNISQLVSSRHSWPISCGEEIPISRDFRELNKTFNAHYKKQTIFPVLLRTYEMMGGAFSVFARDPDFFDSHDIFITVPIHKIPLNFIKALLRRDEDKHYYQQKLEEIRSHAPSC